MVTAKRCLMATSKRVNESEVAPWSKRSRSTLTSSLPINGPASADNAVSMAAADFSAVAVSSYPRNGY
jgi:hypothetical protein